MNNVRTVSDTKRAFYGAFNRPITTVYRRVVEELMVEMHLLSVSTDFVYDALYALGIVTTFDRFMDGYRPEEDRDLIFNSLCEAIGASPSQYRADADALLASLEGLTSDRLKQILTTPADATGDGFPSLIKEIAQRDRFKYSRAFGVGLYRVIERVGPDLTQDKDKLMALLKEACEVLPISFDKLQKDVELYRSNLDKLVQAKAVMADILAADRKKREERAQALAEKAQDKPSDAASDTVTTPSSDTPDEA
ncbi:MAG: photosystem II biogenesis protein Psp29 [Leptolyngbyaceae cyanobacterium T60_A2020_046]|nr:photosystem II biogenesis protein Psp29 [Leptolyngbyaceae cyanobacterium T60_A2020_046]